MRRMRYGVPSVMKTACAERMPGHTGFVSCLAVAPLANPPGGYQTPGRNIEQIKTLNSKFNSRRLNNVCILCGSTIIINPYVYEIWNDVLIEPVWALNA